MLHGCATLRLDKNFGSPGRIHSETAYLQALRGDAPAAVRSAATASQHVLS